ERVAETSEAKAAVGALRDRFRFKRPDDVGTFAALPAAVADEIRRDGATLHVHIPELAFVGIAHRANVTLPVRASGAAEVLDVSTGLTLSLAMRGATDAPAQATGGYVVYRGGREGGGDIVHRVTAEGTEDFIAFDAKPAKPEVTYDIALGAGVAGLR